MCHVRLYTLHVPSAYGHLAAKNLSRRLVRVKVWFIKNSGKFSRWECEFKRISRSGADPTLASVTVSTCITVKVWPPFQNCPSLEWFQTAGYRLVLIITLVNIQDMFHGGFWTQRWYPWRYCDLVLATLVDREICLERKFGKRQDYGHLIVLMLIKIKRQHHFALLWCNGRQTVRKCLLQGVQWQCFPPFKVASSAIPMLNHNIYLLHRLPAQVVNSKIILRIIHTNFGGFACIAESSLLLSTNKNFSELFSSLKVRRLECNGTLGMSKVSRPFDISCWCYGLQGEPPRETRILSRSVL